MRLLSLFALALTLTFGLSSCGDDELPVCIDNILTDFRTTACEGSGALTTWTFKGQKVYCFDWGSCQPDKTIEIYAENCELICELAGPNMETTCDGASWGDSATDMEFIYQR